METGAAVEVVNLTLLRTADAYSPALTGAGRHRGDLRNRSHRCLM